MTKVKICGLYRDCDIGYVNDAGPDYAGFILNFPRSHRNVSPERAAELRAELLPGILAAGVFVDQPVNTVCDIAKTAGLDIIQLHGHEDDAYINEIREKSGLPVWKAFKIKEKADLEAAERSAADEILLDNGYGTGAAFDWTVADGFDRPFILAGGLTPDNIPEAVRRLGPVAVDISSGVETDRAKDKDKIEAAVRAARQPGI